MSAEFCGTACGHCGRCDAEPEHFCDYCGQSGCEGDCEHYYEAMEDHVDELYEASLFNDFDKNEAA